MRHCAGPQESEPQLEWPRPYAALGKVCTFTFYDGTRHGFAVRTHPGDAEDAAKESFGEAKRFLATQLP
jgi:dienelactone hydrolase